MTAASQPAVQLTPSSSEWSLEGWQVGAAWSDLYARNHPGASHRQGAEQGSSPVGRSFQLPQEGSLWLVFSGNLELGLFLEHKKKKKDAAAICKGKEKNLSAP